MTGDAVIINNSSYDAPPSRALLVQRQPKNMGADM